MSSIKVKLEGDLKLVAKLKDVKNLDNVKTVVQKHGDALNTGMKRATTAAFVKGYTHGATARSINTDIVDDGMTAVVGPSTEYSAYVEYGTRKMDAEPFIHPPFEAEVPKFIEDLKKLVR